MSENNKTIDNLTKALAACEAELGTDVPREDIAEYLGRLDAIVNAVKAIKEPHKKTVAVLASQRSRAMRRERVAKALELLEAQEAQEAAESESN